MASELETINILIVEDQPTDLEILKRTLQRLALPKLSTTVARNGQQAKSLLESQAFDLLLLELNLPDMDGYDLIRIAKKTQKQLPVVVVTSLNSEDAALASGRLGADDYIVKDELLGSSLGRTVRQILRPRFKNSSKTKSAQNQLTPGEDWSAWQFPQDRVPLVEPREEVRVQVITLFDELFTLLKNGKETRLKQCLQALEDFAYANKVPAESLIRAHREVAVNDVTPQLASKRRFLLFELLAALIERYRD